MRSGNYIGPLSDSESEDEQQQSEELLSERPVGAHADADGGSANDANDAVNDDAEAHNENGALVMQVDEPASNAIVLHEDKVYYPSAAEVYGDDVETLVQEEDAQPLTLSLIHI